tara:strand:+ start:754 stop:3120 length:2367 start_codon:yes stop_codon:yes gene_type:complete
MGRLEDLIELNKRGALPPNMKADLEELQRRGVIPRAEPEGPPVPAVLQAEQLEASGKIPEGQQFDFTAAETPPLVPDYIGGVPPTQADQQISPTVRALKDAVVEEAPETFGSIAGETLLPAVSKRVLGASGGPVTALLMMLGGGGGAALASVWDQWRQGKPVDWKEVLLQAGFGSAGVPTNKAITSVSRPWINAYKDLKQHVIPEAKVFSEALEERGSQLLHSQATESTMLDIFHNLSESSFTSSGIFRQLTRKQLQIPQELMKELVEKLGYAVLPNGKGLDARDIAKLAMSGLKQNRELSHKFGTSLYTKLDETVAKRAGTSKAVDAMPIVEFMERQNDDMNKLFTKALSRAKITKPVQKADKTKVIKTTTEAPAEYKAGKLGKPKQVTTETSQTIPGGQDRVPGIDTTQDIWDVNKRTASLSFTELRVLRTEILELLRRETQSSGMTSAEKEFEKDLVHILTTQGEDAAKLHNVLDDWKFARDNWSAYKNVYHNHFVSAAIDATPFKFGEKLKNFTPDDIDQLRQATIPFDERRVVPNLNELSSEDLAKWRLANNNPTMDKIKGAKLADLAYKEAGEVSSLLGSTGEWQFSGKKLQQAIAQAPEGTLEAYFTKTELESLKRLGKLAFLLQEKQGSGLGRMAIQLTQVGAVAAAGGGLLEGDLAQIGAGGTILLGPLVLFQLLKSKHGMDVLMQGLSTKIGAPEALGLIARMTAMLVANESLKTRETPTQTTLGALGAPGTLGPESGAQTQQSLQNLQQGTAFGLEALGGIGQGPNVPQRRQPGVAL